MASPRVQIPLVDLRGSLEPIRKALLREWEALLDDMQLFLGPRTEAFEREFSAYCEAPHGVAVSNGTDALVAALRACGVGPGDEVITAANTFFASVEAILLLGATPVLADVLPETLTLDPGEVRRLLGPATRAILPVHLYGHPAEMGEILAIAGERGLRVVEDCAQAHGARWRGRRCGSLGDAGCFSFYFTKNLGALGEAGFVTAAAAETAEALRLLRDHGQPRKGEHAVLGQNLRMDELQAVVLRLKLPGLDAGNARRRALAARYRDGFAGSAVRTLTPRPDCEPVHHLFPVRVRDRDGLREHLAGQGIQTGVHYPVPAHLQPALRGRPHRHDHPKVVEEASRELLSLPIYPELEDGQVERVVEQVLRFVGARA